MSSSTNSAPASQQQAPYVQAPPPAGYPTMKDDSSEFPRSDGGVETKSKGDGFWKGCCAALCCCCALDACFWSKLTYIYIYASCFWFFCSILCFYLYFLVSDLQCYGWNQGPSSVGCLACRIIYPCLYNFTFDLFIVYGQIYSPSFWTFIVSIFKRCRSQIIHIIKLDEDDRLDKIDN